LSEIRLSSEKKLRLFSGRGFPELSEQVASELGIPLTPTSAYDFANGEIFVRFEESVRGCDAFVIQSHSAPINKQIMEQLIMIDALKRASAKRITVVAPFYAYARQDKKSRGREPITARLMADLFKAAGADRLMVVDLHTSQIQGFFDGPVDHLFALPMLANYVGSKVDRSMLTIVSPDSGRVRVAERWSELLGGCPIAFIHKTRDPLIPNEAVVGKVVGDVTGRTCVVIDDMIDTAGTITKAVDALFEGGAKDVIVAATHAVFSGPAVDRLKDSRAVEVVVTDSLPLSDDQKFDKLTVLSIAPSWLALSAKSSKMALVTSLFDGHS
jgi:ribose-phosphate pyrophosphokinase